MAGQGQAGVYHPSLFDSLLFQHNLWFCQHKVQSLSEEGRFVCSIFYSEKWNRVLISRHRIQEGSYPDLNHGGCLTARVAGAVRSSQEELYSQKSPKCRSPQTIVPQFRGDPALSPSLIQNTVSMPPDYATHYPGFYRKYED